MSRRSLNRDIYEAKMAGTQDTAVRLTLLMKSPFKKHRKEALAMGEMVARMQDMVAEAKGSSDEVAV